MEDPNEYVGYVFYMGRRESEGNYARHCGFYKTKLSQYKMEIIWTTKRNTKI